MSLSSEAIVQAAHRLLTEYGLQDVTMRRLASELGVRPGALYYHVPNKQELLKRVAYQLLEPLNETGTGPYSLMQSFRRLVLPLRDGGDLLLIAYALDQEIPPVPALRAGLTAQGRDAVEAEQLSAVLMRFALGSVAAEQNIALLAPDSAGSPNRRAESADLYEKGLRSLLS